MVPKSFKKCYAGKCSSSTFSTPKGKTITQLRPGDQNKSQRRREKSSKPKAVILVPAPTNNILKYMILLLQHPSQLKYF